MQQTAFDTVRNISEGASGAADTTGYKFVSGVVATDTKEVCSNRIRAFVCCFTRLAAFSFPY
jgi:hypothetical protein